MEKLKYPIGLYTRPGNFTPALIESLIEQIDRLPQQVADAVRGLNFVELETPYRPGGWTIRQVVHHLADSHTNALIRFKLALTEDNPVIKPYDEAQWAMLPDSKLPLQPSLEILKGIHYRWVSLLRSLTEEQLNRTYFHPEHKKEFDLKDAIGSYAWHGRHHLAHIELAKKASKVP